VVRGSFASGYQSSSLIVESDPYSEHYLCLPWDKAMRLDHSRDRYSLSDYDGLVLRVVSYVSWTETG
jgi:hypothetical protein